MLETVVVDYRLDVQLNGLDGNDVGYITAFPSASIFSFTPMIGAKKKLSIYCLCCLLFLWLFEAGFHKSNHSCSVDVLRGLKKKPLLFL